MEYFDLDAVLADQERTRATFRTDGFQLSYLDPMSSELQNTPYTSGSGGDGQISLDIQRETSVDLPLWLSTPLAERRYVRIDPISSLSEKGRRELHAGAHGVNLFAKCPNFYSTGRKLLRLLASAERDSVRKTLLKVYRERCSSILDTSQNCREDADRSVFTDTLSVEERKLFDIGNLAASDYRRWKRRRSALQSPPNAAPVRKRSKFS